MMPPWFDNSIGFCIDDGERAPGRDLPRQDHLVLLLVGQHPAGEIDVAIGQS